MYGSLFLTGHVFLFFLIVLHRFNVFVLLKQSSFFCPRCLRGVCSLSSCKCYVFITLLYKPLIFMEEQNMTINRVKGTWRMSWDLCVLNEWMALIKCIRLDCRNMESSPAKYFPIPFSWFSRGWYPDNPACGHRLALLICVTPFWLTEVLW